MEVASQLSMLEEPRKVSLADGRLTLPFTLPRQAVSLVVVDWLHVKK
jgi:hypothetical protein